MPHLHERCCSATLKNRFVGFAVLRCALHRVTRSDDDGAAPLGLGILDGGPPPAAHAAGYGTDAPTGLSVAG